MLLSALVAAVIGALGPIALRRLPEPDGPDEGKRTYIELADARLLWWWLGLSAAALAAIVAAAIDGRLMPVWVLITGVGTWLAYVDWNTHLLPRRWTNPAWVVGVVLVGLSAWWIGEHEVLTRALIGSVAVFAAFYLMWLVAQRFFGGSFGFGDVRLSALLGLGLGTLGPQETIIGMYAGFVLGAIVGVGLSRLRLIDREAFAFGPFMIVGAVLGVLLG